MLRILIFLVTLGVRVLRAMCRRRADLVIENLAQRQQVTALKRERPRPPLEDVDRAFWVALRKSWPAWASRLVIVKADTVAEWNRARFDDIGRASRARATRDGLASMRRFAGSSTRWYKTVGEHRASTPS
jgi:hypothetical protein